MPPAAMQRCVIASAQGLGSLRLLPRAMTGVESCKRALSLNQLTARSTGRGGNKVKTGGLRPVAAWVPRAASFGEGV